MELFVRWVQNGIFHPRFCIHSWKNEGITTPWMYPEVLHIIRDAIELRYKLVPYLYSLSIEATETGHPVIRPTVYHYQADINTHIQSFEFLLGPCLLVASVFKRSERKREIYLPSRSSTEPTQWCNVFTGEWMSGGQGINVPVALEQHGALFAVGGAMIPINPVISNCIDSSRDKVRHIWIFPNLQKGFAKYTISDDEGTAHEPLYYRYRVKMEWLLECVTVGVEIIERSWMPAYNSIVFVLPIGDKRVIKTCTGESSSTGQIEVTLQ